MTTLAPCDFVRPPVVPAPGRANVEQGDGLPGLLEYARCPGGGFHNFLSYQRSWLDAEGGGDCQGQAVRALAEVLGSSLPDELPPLVGPRADRIGPAYSCPPSEPARPQAHAILAWSHLWTVGVKDVEPLESVAWSAARRLVECYHRSQRPDWQWFESRMTYANAVLPHAAVARRTAMAGEDFLEVAEASFAFLDPGATAEWGGG